MTIRKQVIMPTLADMKRDLSEPSNYDVANLKTFDETTDVQIKQIIGEAETLQNGVKITSKEYHNYTAMDTVNESLMVKKTMLEDHNISQIDNMAFTPRGKFRNGQYV